jgi:muconolactone delta-isomerase
MKFLAIENENPGAVWDNTNELLEDEARHVFEIYLSGELREIYFNERHQAVIILECRDLGRAEQILSRFPLVKNELIRFTLMALHPYDGFKRIIRQ